MRKEYEKYFSSKCGVQTLFSYLTPSKEISQKKKMSRVKIASPERYRSLSSVHDNEHDNEHDNTDNSDSEEINSMKFKRQDSSVAEALITIFDEEMAVRRRSEVRRRSPKLGVKIKMIKKYLKSNEFYL